MKRRSFLAMLGLAPAVAAVPASAAMDQTGISRALDSIRPHVDGELKRIAVEHKAMMDATVPHRKQVIPVAILKRDAVIEIDENGHLTITGSDGSTHRSLGRLRRQYSS